eukprot:4337440-Pyramimonas_sp.AAC.1
MRTQPRWLRWSSPWGHEPCEGCAEIDLGWAGNRMRPCCRAPRWSSLWGHEPCEGCAEMDSLWAGIRMRTLPLELSVELLMGPRTV